MLIDGDYVYILNRLYLDREKKPVEFRSLEINKVDDFERYFFYSASDFIRRVLDI